MLAPQTPVTPSRHSPVPPELLSEHEQALASQGKRLIAPLLEQRRDANRKMLDEREREAQLLAEVDSIPAVPNVNKPLPLFPKCTSRHRTSTFYSYQDALKERERQEERARVRNLSSSSLGRSTPALTRSSTSSSRPIPSRSNSGHSFTTTSRPCTPGPATPSRSSPTTPSRKTRPAGPPNALFRYTDEEAFHPNVNMYMRGPHARSCGNLFETPPNPRFQTRHVTFSVPCLHSQPKPVEKPSLVRRLTNRIRTISGLRKSKKVPKHN
ncbi:hypothetical protein GGF50DRAFT_104988 [Schizophyllum commune]